MGVVDQPVPRDPGTGGGDALDADCQVQVAAHDEQQDPERQPAFGVQRRART